MIMFPKALIGLLLTPPALTIYPDTFWKSTLPSPEAGTLSSPLSLLLSPRILFSVLGEELISLILRTDDWQTGPCNKLAPLWYPSPSLLPTCDASSPWTWFNFVLIGVLGW